MPWSINVICSEAQLSKFLRQSQGTYTSMSPPREILLTNGNGLRAVPLTQAQAQKKRGRPGRSKQVPIAQAQGQGQRKRGRPRKQQQVVYAMPQPQL